MSEIVVADPIIEPQRADHALTIDHSAAASTSGAGTGPEPFDSERLPPTLAGEIQKFLRVANLIESEEPRIAYLCRFHAFEVAHSMDRNSNQRGVRQFKTSLLQRLEQNKSLQFVALCLESLAYTYQRQVENGQLMPDEVPTLMRRKDKSDKRELKRVYNAYKEYIMKSGGAFDSDDSHREKLINAQRIASVLFEVLKRVTNAAGPQALADRDSIRAKSDPYVPYNILPLDQGDIQHAIMQFPEIKAAVAAVCNIRGLPSVQDLQKCGPFMDLFQFLQFFFGFQDGNVVNQREHLILLLANTHIRQSHKQISINKELEMIPLHLIQCLLFNGLSKALLPEMAYELHGLLNRENVIPAYGGGFEFFLRNVVSPIYRVISEEALKSKNGTADHSTWRNYDDLNEYFWSRDCFQIGWPMHLDHDFFCVKPLNKSKRKNMVEEKRKREENKDEELGLNEDEELGATFEEIHEPKWLGKTNFVEIRSFWQIFRSFDRLWSFFILSLQAMIIMACHDLGSPLQMLDAVIFEDIMSIFITSAILKLIQAILDIVFTWKTRLMMDILSKRKQVLKLVVAATWTIVLPVCYAKSRRKYTLEMVLFFVPVIHKYIEVSNYQIFKIFSWWTQIKPLIEPTRLILKIGVQNYDWHELFPKVKSNVGALVAIWTPIIVVYFMDTQIWYSVFCTIFGGVYGILNHLGEIRTLGMLRSRFHTLPSAFDVCLIPPSAKNDQKTKRNLFHRRFHKVSENGTNGVAKFVLIWNQIINTFRLEDLISNWELDLMTIPMSSELFSGMVRWPIFLLANKFSTALSIARDFVGKDEILFRKIKKDKYMNCAVKECYESLKYVLEILIVGNLEKRVVSSLLNEIEASMQRSSLLEDFKMSELPALKAKCIELVELLVEGNANQHDNVVKVLQDMFELVTHDMMTNGSRILDLIHSSQQNIEQTEENFVDFSRRIEPQLFESVADRNSIHFPLPDSGPLNEQLKWHNFYRPFLMRMEGHKDRSLWD
ncbi:unnamed protein product [Dovyalis caffra]|uniref:1,3-beta-glucan synthase component FKS1-like domain-containing protein n=1 Tax=Dovyalis caffra TaxID=77055 RepID=A0AAV1SJA1_9ROSI|nr:unnamed protein product [Dovyalis caffra]